MKTLLVKAVLLVSLLSLVGCTGQADFFVKSKDQLKQIKNPSINPSNIPLIITLPSSEWYAVCLEHSCCSGKGFDAVLIMDSDRQFYTSHNNYCGYEGFSARLASEHIQNLTGLRSHLLKHGYKIQKAEQGAALNSRHAGVFGGCCISRARGTGTPAAGSSGWRE
jgi:hypothetical protein